jgi:hypothetical protein
MLTFDIHFEEIFFICAHKGDFFKKILTLVFSGSQLKYRFYLVEKISKKNEKKDESNENDALFLYYKRC